MKDLTIDVIMCILRYDTDLSRQVIASAPSDWNIGDIATEVLRCLGGAEKIERFVDEAVNKAVLV